ncbi:hypothetical protein GGR56DRAFT_535259 [Xylariaceae sp. FL0804]|nr:hypothetical protein GGR56DRAFT_535259 [Xylariaceae sp. FL0804]
MLALLPSLLLAFTGIGAALPERRGIELQTTTTVTGYAHPLSFSPLQTRASTATALTYGSSPSPSSVPTAAAPAAAAVVRAAAVEDRRAYVADGSSSSSSTSSSVCTSIAGSYATTTVPGFCNPSALVNAPSLLAAASSSSSGQPPLALATATIAAAASGKLDCCAACAAIYNCVAWRFVPVFVGDPSPELPGGFDPWGRGACEAVYHTGGVDDDDGVVTLDGAADVCPNGRVRRGVLANGTADVAGPGGSTRRWSNLYYNGWNEGACGDAEGVFATGTNPGTGDSDTLCSVGSS